MIPITIERMTAEWVPAVAQLDRESFSLPWTERSYFFEVEKNETSIPLIALTGGAEGRRLSGFVVVWQVEDEAHVGTLAVAAPDRRMGVARRLILEALAQAADRGARKAFLEVRAGNAAAQNLYRNLGFTDFDLRRRYYSDNQEDALVMLLDPIPTGREEC